jgi:signal transduction histidine kinase/ActR/RegA family two-component response regulator
MRTRKGRQSFGIFDKVRRPILLVLLTGLVVSSWSWYRTRQAVRDEALLDFRAAAQNRAIAIERTARQELRWLAGVASASQVFSNVEDDTRFLRPACDFARKASSIRWLGRIHGTEAPATVELRACEPEKDQALRIRTDEYWPGILARAARQQSALLTPPQPDELNQFHVSMAVVPLIREGTVTGYLVTAIDHSAQLEHAVQYLVGYGIHIVVADETPGQTPRLLAFHRSRRGDVREAPESLESFQADPEALITAVEIAGRTWRIFCLPADGLLAPPPLTGISAFLGSMLITGLVGMIIFGARRQARAVRRLVEQRTSELASARDAALDAVRTKAQFLATMSHEIRTPMNGVIGMADLLADTPLDTSQRDLLDNLRISARALLDIVNDILDLSKIEAGKLVIASDAFDLAETVDRAVQLFAVPARQKGIELAHNLPEEVSTMVRGDSGRLGQVLANLIGNAVKFTDSGSVLVAATLTPLDGENAIARFEVKDTGAGIDAMSCQRLFQPFVQADGSFRRKHGGTGLGLAISRHLVLLMGGEVGVTSDPGKGSTFWFTVALKRAEAVPRSAPKLPAVAGTRVMLIGESIAIKSVARGYLEAWQARVEHYPDLAAAARHLMDEQPRESIIVIADFSSSSAADSRVWLQGLDLFDVRVILLAAAGQAYELDIPLRFQPLWVPLPIRRSRLLEALRRIVSGNPDDGLRLAAANRADQRASLLLVEDNPVNQRVAVGLIRKLGYEVEAVSSGTEAIEAIRANSYQAILMDCQMPEMDGFEVTARIRQMEGDAATTPIIALTANALPGDRERCLEAGMDDYIPKPLQMARLAEVLGRWTRNGMLT